MKPTNLHTTGTITLPLALGVLLLLVAGGCGGLSTNPMINRGEDARGASVAATVSVGTAPHAIAADSANNKIYVADFGTEPISGSSFCSPTGGDVRVIDGVTESSAVVPVPFAGDANPISIALNPATHTAYVVANEWGREPIGRGCAWISDDVTAIDTSSLSAAEIYSGLTEGPWGFLGIDLNPATGDIYLAEASTSRLFPDNSIIVIGSSAAKIAVGIKPTGVAVNTETNKVYVANSVSDNISVIDGATNAVVATITDPNAVAPVGVAVNPATGMIYVANSQSNNLTVIDGATDSVKLTIPVGTSPSAVAVDPQTNFIYVANQGDSHIGDSGNITVINAKTSATSSLSDPNAKNPVAIAVNALANKIYVANYGSSNVTVIDGAHD